MINPFKQLGDIKKMRDQAMQIQRELQGEEVDIEKNGVHILISGDQKIKLLESNGRSDDDIKDAVKALGVIEVTTELTFSPPWKMPEGLRMMMGV